MTYRSGLILAIIAILLVLGIYLVVFNRPADIPNNLPGGVDLKELATLQTRSLALLENQQPRDSLTTLVELKEKFPTEADFADHNLCVAHFYLLELENAAADNDKFNSELQAANQHFEQVGEKFGQNLDYLILKSRLAGIQKLTERQIDALKEATKVSPETAEVWFELLQILKESDNNNSNDNDLKLALEKCLELLPDNVWVNLQVLGVQQNTSVADIRTALSYLKDVITPFASGIEARSRVNPVTFIDQAVTQLDENDEKRARRTIRILNNILLPEDIAQSDRRIVERNTLEYLRWNLSQPNEEKIRALRLTVPTAIDLEFNSSLVETEVDFSEIKQCDVVDINLDGKYEILVLEENRLSILHQQKENKTWQVKHQIPLENRARSFVLADLDLDADVNRPATIEGAPCALADLDVVILHETGLTLIENRLGNLAEAEPAENDAPFFVPVNSQNLPEQSVAVTICLPVDFDLDGDLDLCIVYANGNTRLWANHANFKFADVSARSELPPNSTTWAKAVAVDIDRDVDIDIMFAGQTGVGYLENLRHGSLRWREITKEADDLKELTDVAVADINHDASWDLMLCNGKAPILIQSVISETGTTRWEKPVRLDLPAAHQVHLWDSDNDGFEDITLFDKQAGKQQLTRRSDSEGFTPTSLFQTGNESLTGSSTVGIAEDIDGDGDLDWFSWNQSQLSIAVNEGGNSNGYLRIGLVGAQVKGGEASASGRVNHYGWGSLCELKSAGHYQAKVVNRQTTHFGLGDQSTADLIRILWPNGIPHNVIHPEKNAYLCENQRLKGSCPYLYVWDGDEFQFYTDLLWASPIGLQFADGIIAPTRPWEYLLIDGHRMKAKDDHYEFQVTEELWEAAYFDQIELIAVDHPQNTSVFSNEKVASSETPAFKIHTVQEPRTPVTAVDKNGRDVLNEIAKRDDIYTRLFNVKFNQGVTEQHFLEIDLGDVAEEDIKLFLTGWVYPTDTSMNVALGQSPEVPKPRPPFLQVIDENGNWKTVNPSMGFPGGKTKTIVIDLSGIFLTTDRKLRIVTSMEIYWDHVFFTAGEIPVEIRKQTTKMKSADLHWRGYSQVQFHPANGPETYLYKSLQEDYDWPPMKGPFTRYGNVTELIRAADDRMVVMGAGDEMTVRFEFPTDPLPEGWKRDFILHNVGYDKDADLNTIYGQATEPYPTQGNPTYPANQDEEASAIRQLPAHARQQSSRRFWNMIRRYQTQAK